MRSAPRALLAVLVAAFLLAIAGARPADADDCDVVVTPANAASTLTFGLLNDSSLRVFCVTAGDYRSAGQLLLLASGSESQPRVLRFHPEDGAANALHRAQRATFHALRMRGSWWVIRGLTVQPQTAGEAGWFIGIEGGDHNRIERNLVDGSQHDNQGPHSGIVIAAWGSDPALRNQVLDNVVRSGNQNRLAVDYAGIAVSVGLEPGSDNDFNEIRRNEVYDWGDGIALVAFRDDCLFPGRPHGTVIDDNDIYLTGDKRIDCADGTPDPDGDCSCAENGIDVKPDPGPDPALWTRVTNNRLWGFRPTRTPSTCGGSGSNGQAIQAGSQCAGHVFVAGNVVMDSHIGIKPQGSNWTVSGNLFADVRRGFLINFGDSDLEIQFNTVIGVENAYDDPSTHTDTLCNVVIENQATNGNGWPRATDHETEYNYLYDSPTYNFVGDTNQVFPTAGESRNGAYCFTRRRWTAPETVCVPFARTTPESPHAAAASHCERDLGAPLGLGPIGFTSFQAVPEPRGGASAGGVVLALALAARHRARSSQLPPRG
jgi:hypothetical protein